MAIFLGACSGEVFGNDTVKTPFSSPALISSLCGGTSKHTTISVNEGVETLP